MFSLPVYYELSVSFGEGLMFEDSLRDSFALDALHAPFRPA